MPKKSIDTERISREADKLAKMYKLGSEDAELLRKQAFRLAEEGLYDPEQLLGFSLLGEALEYSENPSVMLRIFQVEDLRILDRRRSDTVRLFHVYTPFYTLDELTNHIEAFCRYLEQNKKHPVAKNTEWKHLGYQG